MYRRVIIISNNGGPSNFLPGVEKDVEHYIQYFKSFTGGRYLNSEILWFQNNCSESALISYINFCQHVYNVHHFLIVFCGHGYGLSNGDFMMEFGYAGSCTASNLMKVVGGDPCLLIADCCRKSIISTPNNPFQLNAMFNIASACTNGEFALDTDDGGLYSSNLIQNAKFMHIAESNKNHSIEAIHNGAAKLVRLVTKGSQNPQIAGSGISVIPFTYKI